MGRVAAWTDNDEVVVHHVAAVDAEPIGDELVLSRPIVDEKRVGVASRPYSQRLAGTDRHNMNVQAAGGLKERQDVAE